MTDNMTPAESQSDIEVSFAQVEAPKKGLGGAGFSRGGKLAIGAVLLLLILAVAAGAFFVFFGGSSGSTQIPLAPQSVGAEQALAQSSPAATAPASSQPTITPVEPAEVPLTDVFTFRDIFEPLAKAPSTTSSTTTTTTTETTETSNNTILLQDIISENGEPHAVLVWNGTTYTLAEGEQVGDSPWSVLEIDSDSVIMLYGDVQVSLSIGQAITK